MEDNDTMEELEHPVGVIVTVRTEPQGLRVFYNPVGGFEPLAVPVLLELAAKMARNDLGIGSH